MPICFHLKIHLHIIREKKELLELLKRQPSLGQPLINNGERSEDELIDECYQNQASELAASEVELIEFEKNKDIKLSPDISFEDYLVESEKLKLNKKDIIAIFPSLDKSTLIFITKNMILFWDCYKNKKIDRYCEFRTFSNSKALSHVNNFTKLKYFLYPIEAAVLSNNNLTFATLHPEYYDPIHKDIKKIIIWEINSRKAIELSSIYWSPENKQDLKKSLV